jgi:hypothetical protein
VLSLMNNKMSGFEKRKVSIDLMKHLATLAAAFVAVLAASIEYLSKISDSTYLIEIGVLSFLACIVSSVTTILILLANIEDLVMIAGSKTPSKHGINLVILAAH